MMNSQLELSLPNLPRCCSRSRRQTRLARARSWFQLMRDLIDNTADWQPAPAPSAKSD